MLVAATHPRQSPPPGLFELLSRGTLLFQVREVEPGAHQNLIQTLRCSKAAMADGTERFWILKDQPMHLVTWSLASSRPVRKLAAILSFVNSGKLLKQFCYHHRRKACGVSIWEGSSALDSPKKSAMWPHGSQWQPPSYRLGKQTQS